VAADVPGAAGRDPVARYVRAVFALLDPDEFRRCFLSWAQAVVGPPGAQVVAIDGKTLRRSHDRRGGQEALHLVSAWAAANGLVIGQVATDAKSNEITAIPALLKLLALEGATVTIDAMGCQTAIAAQLVEQRADYVLALKDNHEKLHDRVKRAFADADAAAGTTLPLSDLVPHTTHDRGHGRIEHRRCLAIGDPAYLAFIDPEQAWPHLKSVVRIESTRRIGTTVSTEARHYLSSLPAGATALSAAIRSQWGIESAPRSAEGGYSTQESCQSPRGRSAALRPPCDPRFQARQRAVPGV